MEWSVLSSLAESERSELIALGRRRGFDRAEVVCHAGDPADALHLVVSGHLSVQVSLESGDTAMIRVLGPGDSFGELALLRPDGQRTATITALEPAETIAISGRVFGQLCERRPQVQRTLSVMLAERVNELSRQVLELAYLAVDQRVCRRLVELATGYAATTGAPVVPITQSQLADLCGGTRPTINQALQKLVEQGTIELGRGRITVLDVDRLRRDASA